MVVFQSSLLREKFSIYDSNPETQEQSSIIALSNRLVVEFETLRPGEKETIVIRSHNMHSCVRMAARLIKSYKTSGPILGRTKPYDWEAAWNSIVNDYEYRFNPARWIAIYSNGKILYQAGEHHMLLDIIEKLAMRSKDNYEKSIKMAEDAFKQAGKIVTIDYDSNVALVINMDTKLARFGVIIRGPTKTHTFNFSVAAKGRDPLNQAQCLAAAASFLEGIQLAFQVGMNNIKLYMGIIARRSHDEKKTKEGSRRLNLLVSEIAALERTYEVRYRPEKPEFHMMVNEAERHGQKVLKPPAERAQEEDSVDDQDDDQHGDDGPYDRDETMVY